MRNCKMRVDKMECLCKLAFQTPSQKILIDICQERNIHQPLVQHSGI